MAPSRPKIKRSRAHKGTGKLVINLKDLNGQPVASRSKVLVTDAARAQRHTAVGKDKQVTRFTFEIPPGEYDIVVDCEGYEDAKLLVSVQAKSEFEQDVVLNWQVRRAGKKANNAGDRKLVDGRFERFLHQRVADKNEFPTDARERALTQKRHMLDEDIINALQLQVNTIQNPVPHSSFGDIDSFVQVRPRKSNKDFKRALLKIPYSPKKLGWVNPATLRVFEIDPKKRRFRLIPESSVDPERLCAYAYIDKPGIFGVIGLPSNAAVLETVRMFVRLRPPAGKGGAGSIQERICQVILCAKDAATARGERLTPPGGVEGNVCDFCTGLDVPPGGLPEGQILAGPPPPPGPMAMCSWLSIGPRNINGRIRAMTIHPNNGSNVFAGTANAGVWATTDAGVSWTPLMFQEGALEIGALAVHLTDPANPLGDITLYAGTGEPTSWPGYKGVGVLKSTTSGAPGSWMPTGSILSPGGDRFAAVTIDPTSVTANPATAVVYAGGPGGLYKSTNGGGAWTQVLNKNIQSIALDPANPQIVYVGAAFEGIFKFDPATSTWNAFNAGLPGSFPQLIAVDIGRSAPHRVYAKLDTNVYVFNITTNMWQSLGSHGGQTYGYWSNFLAVDPLDSNIVVVGGFSVERTYDGGTTWHSPSVGHEDNHAIVFDTSNHLNLYVGNDGGVFRGTYSSSPDTGTWTKRSDGMTISALNAIGSSATEGPDFVGCGVQDNGTIRTAGGLTWDSLPIGGDGSAFIIDPANPLIIYGQLTTIGVNGHPYKSTDGGASFSPADSGFPDGTFVGVLVLDPNSPPEPNRVLFVSGGNAIYRSTNSAGSWSQSSPALGGSPSAIAVAPSSSAVVYAGSNSGAIWRSVDGGATIGNWKNIKVGTLPGSANLPPRSISAIVVHPTDSDTVFIAFSGFNAGSPGHVYKGTSSDGWTTWQWQNITANLPDIPVNAMEINRTAPGTLWVGTDTGVFQTTDGGLTWVPFDNGLPNVVVGALALNAAGDRLRAATYGYSMWEMPLSAQCDQVDVYVRDNKLDTGEATALSGIIDPTAVGSFVYWWEGVDAKVNAYPYYAPPPDGIEFDRAIHDNPVRNDGAHPNPNRLYIQVHNRGPQPTNNVKVKVLWADASAGLPALPSDFWSTFPNAWSAASAWAPIDPAVPFQTIPQLLPHTPKILTWNWTVPTTAATHSCVLTVISSDEDPVSHSDMNPNDHLIWMLAPNDKHIALKNMTIVTAAGIPPGGIPLNLDFHNATRDARFFDIIFAEGTLPRGSKVSLLTPAVKSRGGWKKNENGVPVRPSPRKKWKLEFQLSDGVVRNPCDGKLTATVPGILIAPGKTLRTAVVILPGRGRPGAIYRCAILQRDGATIVGGNTYEVRVPPVEIVVAKRSDG
jgi:hypothetical protein